MLKYSPDIKKKSLWESKINPVLNWELIANVGHTCKLCEQSCNTTQGDFCAKG